MTKSSSPKKKVKLTARKWNGDDYGSWAIFRSDWKHPVVSGLEKREIPYHKNRIQKLIEGTSK